MYDRPGLILLTLCAAFGPLAGFAVMKRFGFWYDSLLAALFIDIGTLYIIKAFVDLMIADVSSLTARDVKPSVAPQPEPRVILNMNKADGYALTTQAVSIDVMTIKIKRFSRTLITQRENGFKVDLREKTWEGQFGGRKNYVHVRDVRMAGAFAKETELINSPFIVADWRVVEAAANGRM